LRAPKVYQNSPVGARLNYLFNITEWLAAIFLAWRFLGGRYMGGARIFAVCGRGAAKGIGDSNRA